MSYHRRGGAAPLKYTFPDGTLVKLFLAHIGQGHNVLTMDSATWRAGKATPPNLFVSRDGRAFSNATLVHYWSGLMAKVDTLGQSYFPPSLARTMFVEEYTSAHGADPSTWDGCAAIMGNSTRQWRDTYNPSRKRRAAQRAIDVHNTAQRAGRDNNT